MISFHEQKDRYIDIYHPIHSWSDKAFKGTDVKSIYSSIYGESLKHVYRLYNVYSPFDVYSTFTVYSPFNVYSPFTV